MDDIVRQYADELKKLGKNKHYTNKDGRKYAVSSDGQLLLAPGPYPIQEPEVYQLDVKTLNKYFLEARRRCYACGNQDNIGIALKLKATSITDEERQTQSVEDKLHNNHSKSNNEQKYYPMFPVNPKPTKSVMFDRECDRLSVEIVPVYICVHCRRHGECGSKLAEKNYQYLRNFNGNIVVPSAKERNIINKYMQRSCSIVRYVDSNGKIYSITDRFNIMKSPGEYEDNLLQQLELITNPVKFGEFEEYIEHGNKKMFIAKLAYTIKKVIPTLLRAAEATMVKKGNHQNVREMQDFEPFFEYALIFVRAALHFITKYPEIKQKLIYSVYLWASNPFSQSAKQFDNWKDIIWIASLVGIPFATYRQSIIIKLFNIMLLNFPVTEERMAKKDKVTYLRQLFNEGRNNKLQREFLYSLAFAGMIGEEIQQNGANGFIKLLDDHSCYLPDKYLIKVWREMKYINDNIKSIEPIENDKQNGHHYQPGMWKHLGMGDQDADIEQTKEEIFVFLDYARRYGIKMCNTQIPEYITSIIQTLSADHSHRLMMSSISRNKKITQDEEKRIKKLRGIHKGDVPLDPIKGAPRLTELKCAFPKCGRKFKSIKLFKKHLKEAFGSEPGTPKFSTFEMHRMASNQASEFDPMGKHWDKHPLIEYFPNYQNMEISPEYFKKNNITKCPVPHCHSKFSNCKELCEHFARYGVSPFWYPGWKPKLLPANNDPPIEKKLECVSSWENPGQCIVCLDSPCEYIIIPCGHVNMCSDCFDQWTTRKDTCPSCRIKIEHKIPLMSFSAQKDKISVFFCS